jgi:hypothetical protein
MLRFKRLGSGWVRSLAKEARPRIRIRFVRVHLLRLHICGACTPAGLRSVDRQHARMADDLVTLRESDISTHLGEIPYQCVNAGREAQERSGGLAGTNLTCTYELDLTHAHGS